MKPNGKYISVDMECNFPSFIYFIIIIILCAAVI